MDRDMLARAMGAWAAGTVFACQMWWAACWAPALFEEAAGRKP